MDVINNVCDREFALLARCCSISVLLSHVEYEYDGESFPELREFHSMLNSAADILDSVSRSIVGTSDAIVF